MTKPAFFDDYKKLISSVDSMTKTKGGYGYKYVELAPLLEEVLPKIHENNFILTQAIKQTGGEYNRTTTEPAVYDNKKGNRQVEGTITKSVVTPAFVLHSELIHESGEKIECDTPLYVDDIDPQAFGSAETYMRRYSIYALLHIKTEDDDGAAASSKAKKTYKEPETFADFVKSINSAKSDKQISALWYKWKEKFTEGSEEYKDLTMFSKNMKQKLQNPQLTVDVLNGCSVTLKEIVK